jgi:DNA primase large subunit
MQVDRIDFTKSDLAKYPFLKVTAKYIRQLNLQISELASNEMEQILQRAEERITEAVLYVSVTRKNKPTQVDAELSSYPVALMLVAATGSSFIIKRYALAEAKRASVDLTDEKKEIVFLVAQDFGWKLSLNPAQSKIPHEFMLSFNDYLRNISQLRFDSRWRLINRIMLGGFVYLNQSDIARLLQEEIRNRIESGLNSTKTSKLPSNIIDLAEKLKNLAIQRIGTSEREGFPKTVVKGAFPPCINALYDAASSSRHLSHLGRFTLTSFLVSIGLTSEKVNELFKSFSDYNERLTRYQIEHIAGERGSRTKYTPPQCTTLKTHGICVNSDDLCRTIRHPLAYYKRKIRRNSEK